MKKIVFISPSAYVGVSSVGRHGEKAGLWDFKYFEDLESNEINADIVILGGYYQPYNRLEIDGKFGYWWTSSCFEIEQTGVLEINYLANILNSLNEDNIDFVLFGDRGIGKLFEYEVGAYTVPYPVDTSLKIESREKVDGIGFFVPQKLSKNILTTLFAFREFQKSHSGIKLHSNLKSYEQIMKFLDIEYHLYDWLGGGDYHSLLATMKANLHCTIAETNAYQVWEASLLNVPSVVSHAVDWYPLKELIVDNTNDIVDISDKIGKCICGDGVFANECYR